MQAKYCLSNNLGTILRGSYIPGYYVVRSKLHWDLFFRTYLAPAYELNLRISVAAEVLRWRYIGRSGLFKLQLARESALCSQDVGAVGLFTLDRSQGKVLRFIFWIESSRDCLKRALPCMGVVLQFVLPPFWHP